MADQKITQLTALASPANEDLFPIVDDVAGTPVTKKVTLSNVRSLFRQYNAINVLENGMVGDASRVDASGTDDGPALQAIIDASILSGGVSEILIPGRRTYKIGSNITVPTGVRIRGIGARNAEDSPSPPRLVWGGAEDGIMFTVGETGLNNTTSVVFENLSLCGRSDGTNRPGTFIKYGNGLGGAQSPDSSTWLHSVWFDSCRSDAIISNLATNFYIQNCRWDAVGLNGRYGIYADLPTAGEWSVHLLGHNTFTVTDNGIGGFMFLDAEGGTGTPLTNVKIDALKLEVGADLAETYAGGAKNYDKRGLIRLGVSDSIGNTIHHIQCDMLTVNNTISGFSSYSVFQVTASGGTDNDNSDLVQVIVDSGLGLCEGDTDTGADDISRVIGGRIPTLRRPPSPLDKSGRWGRFQYGRGLGTGYGLNKMTSWIHSMSYQVDYLITGPVVASTSLDTGAQKGSRAYVSDATTNTFNTVVAGGSTCNVPVHFDGTSWRIG